MGASDQPGAASPEMVKINGIDKFMDAASMKKYMEEDYADIKAFLVELELAKK